MQLQVKKPINIAAQAYPWTMACKHYTVEEGMTIEEILLKMLKDSACPFGLENLNAHVYIKKTYIPRGYWHLTRPEEGTTVTIKLVPGKGGGKNPLATILSIAVIAAAAWAGPAVAAAIGGTTGTVAGAITSGLIVGIGNLLVAAIAPPPKQRLSNNGSGNQLDSQTLFIQGARNQARPFEAVPVILGKHKFVPPLASETFTETSGDKQYVRQLFCWGLGKYELTNLRIGETPIENFTNIEMEHFTDGEGNTVVSSLYPNSVVEEGLSLQLTAAGGATTRTTQPSANEIIVDVTCPRGLFSYSAAGVKQSQTVAVQIRYAPTGTTDWIETVTMTLTLSTSAVVRRSQRFITPSEGTYDVEMLRLTEDTSSDQVFNETWWTALRTVTYENPINIPGVSFSAMYAQATDQFNGSVDQLSGDLFSIIPDWDSGTETWIERTTNNPASLWRFVLQNSSLFTDPTNAPNARPLTDDRIDLDGIQDWHDYCVENGFECNIVVDFDTNVMEVLREICSAGRANITMVDGKWSVIIDNEKDIISQCFTSANTWGFSSKFTFPEIPHALRIKFLNEEQSYIQDEMLVFDDGYSLYGTEPGTVAATNIQTLDLPGITKPDLIWRHGRKYLAEMRLRPREITFMTDAEHLAASRGSWIEFAHPRALVGVAQGYIEEVNVLEGHVLLDDDGEALLDDDGYPLYDDTATILSIKLDRKVTMDGVNQYRIKIRKKQDNSLSIYEVDYVEGPTDVLTFSMPVTAGAIQEDDLFAFGIANFETIKLVVRDVVPDKDLTARMTCYDAAPGIFTAEEGTIPPFQSGITIPLSLKRPVAPDVVDVQTGIEVQVRNLDNSISSRMIITLRNINPFNCIPVVLIKPTDANDYIYADTVYASETKVIIEGLEEGKRYDLKIYYRKVINSDQSGILGNLHSPMTVVNNILFEGEGDDPPDVTGLSLQIIGSSAVLTWTPVNVLDFSHYEVRFTPVLDGVNWASAYTIRARYTHTEVTLAATRGTYLVKAFDRGGRESANPAAVATLVQSETFNAVENIEESPTFGGTHSNTTVDAGSLILDNLSLGTGTYTFAGTVDLEEVFTSKVTPVIEAQGRNITNTLASWVSLSSVTSLSGATGAQWGVKIQERHTEDDPGGSPTWTDWADLTQGYLSFRAAQFRAILIGNGGNTTPSVDMLGVIIDMPDRVEKASNVTIPDTGGSYDYGDDYFAVPSVVITILNPEEGDVITVSNETEAGFDVAVTNAGVGVERVMNWHSIGYGRRIT